MKLTPEQLKGYQLAIKHLHERAEKYADVAYANDQYFNRGAMDKCDQFEEAALFLEKSIED